MTLPTAHIGIETVMTGELYTGSDGSERLAAQDMVRIISPSHARTIELTPAQAMTMGVALSQSAGRLINAQVDDNGRPLSFLTRLARLRGTR